MNLNNITVETRPRKPWEAVDLGFKLAQRYWKTMMAGWLILAAPFVLLGCLLDEQLPYWGIIIWWLKPLFERPSLYILSRGIFAEDVSLKATFKGNRSFFTKQLLLSLTFRRLSLTRSFDMPVALLESLKGKQRQSRLRVLHLKHASTASWLTIVLLHMEAVITFALLGIIVAMIPETVSLDSEQLLDENLLLTVLNVVAMAVIAPFYMGAGFALYLNRRIKLEGWDIELAFRQIANDDAARKEESVPKRHLASFVLAGIMAASFWFGDIPQAQAEDVKFTEEQTIESDINSGLDIEAEQDLNVIDPAFADEKAASKRVIDDILAGDDFHQKEVVKIPRFIADMEVGRQKKPKESSGTFESLLLLAKSLEVVIWVIVIGVVLLMIYRYRGLIGRLADINLSKKQRPVVVPKSIRGLAVTEESLPENITEAVLAFWQAGQHREGLSLLYRATLTRLILDFHIRFKDSDTELECLDRLIQWRDEDQTSRQPLYTFSNAITQSWRALAYGHQVPEESKVVTLCDEWNALFTPPFSEHEEGAEK